MLKRLLIHPLMRNRDLDDPQTTEVRKRLVHEKKFLEQIYIDWYELVKNEALPAHGLSLEIGAGAGFLEQYLGGIIKTEIFYLAGMDAVLDAANMPFKNSSISLVVMTDVFHHLPDPRRFLSELVRILPPGGRMVMIEPWVSKWSSFIYPRFHHEPYNPNMVNWEFPSSGPLSGSNQALPWIIFERDKAKLHEEFPELSIETIKPMMPFRYLLSGGVSLRSMMPQWTTPFWRWFENLFSGKISQWGMFALLVIQKN
jgi:SAM-dependent methyltransferase